MHWAEGREKECGYEVQKGSQCDDVDRRQRLTTLQRKRQMTTRRRRGTDETINF